MCVPPIAFQNIYGWSFWTSISRHFSRAASLFSVTPFPWASTVTNGSAKAKSQLSSWRDPFPWTDPSLTGPGSELFTCLSVPPSGGGWQRGGAIPVPEGMGSNGPRAGPRWLAVKMSVSGLVFSALTAVRFVRERSAYPPGQRNVDYGCFDGQRNLDHTTERL